MLYIETIYGVTVSAKAFYQLTKCELNVSVPVTIGRVMGGL